MKKITTLAFILALSISFNAKASELSQCSQVGKWADAVTQVKLKNSGILGEDTIDKDRISISLIAEEKVDDLLYKQVHLITYHTKNEEKKIEVISVNMASKEECSMSGVDVYVISQSIVSNINFE